jgi:ribosomal protein L11 methylase PrmA
MNVASPDLGSFRDPAGAVYEYEGRIYRTVNPSGVDNCEAIRETGFLEKMVDQGRVVGLKEVSSPEILERFPDAVYVLEHPRIDYISYPYEWCFYQLKKAALHHLDLALDALADGLTLSDATAYNIQYIGPKPIFIDHLSFRPYSEGGLWLAHNQFCEQFLNPLLLSSECGIQFNDWYRGRLEGISTEDIAKLLPFRARLSLRMNAHVFLPAMFEKGSQRDAVSRGRGKEIPSLSRAGYEGLLRQLKGWISGLVPKGTKSSVWADYADANTYDDAERNLKRDLIQDFATRIQPDRLIDLGCNSGDFSQAALEAGAKSAIGYDFDHGALMAACQRAEAEDIAFLPLFLDAANPSPEQGWSQVERSGFSSRARGNSVLALAFIHHLAIGKNIPLEHAIRWIVERAETGLIEFVPKSDPTVQAMLNYREDIFSHYTIDEFRGHLSRMAHIEKETVVSGSGRAIFEYRIGDK